MSCESANIKQLIPSYLHHELDKTDVERVEAHLASCPDCRMELSLLGILSDEAVPDPGDSFWTEMPVKIEREVRRRRERKRFTLAAIFTLPALRPAWTAVAVVLTATVFWFLARPAPRDIATGAGHVQYESASPDFTESTVNMAEMSAPEVQAVGRWAQNEYGRIRREFTEDDSGNTEQNYLQDISDLDAAELERLYEILKKKEHDLREKSRETKNQISAG